MSKRPNKRLQSKPVPPDPQENLTAAPQHRIRLPGFVTDDDVGLGDLIKRATATLGIKPCDKCNQRAAKLNQWLAFTRRRSK